MFGAKKTKQCVGLDFDLNNLLVADLGSNEPAFPFREKLPFMDKVERVAEKYKIQKTVLPVTCISGEGIMLKSLRLPGDVREKEIPEAVRWQFKDMEDDMVLRHCVTGRSNYDNWLVIAAAVPQALIDNLTNRITRFGLDEPHVIDLRVLALWRAAKYLRPEKTETAIAILEETPTGARIVAGRSFPEFAREISGDNLEFEIRRTITHYKSEFTDKVEILVVGKDLPEDVAAIGMALYPYSAPGVNYLTERKILTKKKDLLLPGKVLGKVAGASVIWLAILAVPWMASFWWDIRANVVKESITNLRPTIAQSDTTAAKTAEIKQWSGVLQSFKTLTLSIEMDDLRYAMPKSCWLTDLQTMSGSGDNKPAGKANERQNGNNLPQSVKQELQEIGGGKQQNQSGNLPPVAVPSLPTGLKVYGYSEDVNSIAAFRDNLSKLSWVDNPSIMEIANDSKLGAYKFTMYIYTKGGLNGASSSSANS